MTNAPQLSLELFQETPRAKAVGRSQPEAKDLALRASSSSAKGKINDQAKRILALLNQHVGICDGWVTLPSILHLFIANYRMRITELRRAGYKIELKDEHVEGQRHTAYRLVQ